ncbi:MAG: response regulator [Proteobacteria bacterium]|nr:MAG: response regulator [Pseudomonadota bacterium]
MTKILVAEDDFISRTLITSMLAPFGVCHAAADGEEAVVAFRRAQAEGAPYDLVCLDIMMPRLDGHGVLKAIREAEWTKGVMPGNGAKVVMTTALSGGRHALAAFREQCDGYLVKPLSRDAIVAVLAELGFAAGGDAANDDAVGRGGAEDAA